MLSNRTELFDQLYRENQNKVFKLAIGMTGNIQEAEEITQEAFFRAFRSYDSFREEAAFSTWIYRITINVANDYLKQRDKFPVCMLTEDLGFSLEDILDLNPDNDPETELLANQARVKCLHSLTECLPNDHRKVFCLAVTLGLPHKVVAEILECSVASVKTTLHRAKQRWFGYMEDRCQLIRKSNPCNCKQWVRFGLERGWIAKDTVPSRYSAPAREVREEIGHLKSLRDIYYDIYPEQADSSYIERMREGIRNGEWGIFSEHPGQQGGQW